MKYLVEKYGEVTSTNDIAAKKAKSGAPEGTVVLAEQQNCGRGRMGRTFMSPGGGVYMSVVLRPSLSAEQSLLITTAAAVAVAETVEKFTGKVADIKWVNDVYLDGKKVCGILTEGAFAHDGSLAYAILGIGVNVIAPSGGFDKEIENIAGSLFENGAECDKEAIARDILDNFARYYEHLERKPHFDGYVRRSMLHGKTVTVLRGGEEVCTADVKGITADFALRILTERGEETLTSGEVSVKLK